MTRKYLKSILRTIPQLVAEAKKIDPQTAITERGLRRLVKEGKIPCIKIGTKTLINAAALQDYLYFGEKRETKTSERQEML